jgi:hypothetical protein
MPEASVRVPVHPFGFWRKRETHIAGATQAHANLLRPSQGTMREIFTLTFIDQLIGLPTRKISRSCGQVEFRTPPTAHRTLEKPDDTAKVGTDGRQGNAIIQRFFGPSESSDGVVQAEPGISQVERVDFITACRRLLAGDNVTPGERANRMKVGLHQSLPDKLVNRK